MRRRFHWLALCLGLLAGCSLARPAPPPATPRPTAALPQARIAYPSHNQQVYQGLVFDIQIHAQDSVQGIQSVELYVDEQLLQTSESESGAAPEYRVNMNYFAKELGWHKFAAVAIRPDGARSHPHIIALEFIPPG